MHFSRVKDCVLVAVQRRDAGRAQHETLFYKKMREEQTALKSGSSPLALPSFPKLLTPLHKSQRLLLRMIAIWIDGNKKKNLCFCIQNKSRGLFLFCGITDLNIQGLFYQDRPSDWKGKRVPEPWYHDREPSRHCRCQIRSRK